MKMWSEEKKAHWEAAKQKLGRVNRAFERHEGLFGGDIPSDDPNAAAEEQRKLMLRETRDLEEELIEFFLLDE